ncbi:hypothetical protein CEJ87_11550 [Caldifermentibacillus hisashii]|nr:hypothetical protein CEJ87_11550 [Caldifermentibacillus hisashii]
MGQKRRNLKQKCLIEQLYGTKLFKNKIKCPIEFPDSWSMGQKRRKMEQKCLIEQLYGTKLVEK